eukprot:COSAG01_NODE_4010_length_5437_cov_5.981828_9_plen_178_part_00
MAGAAAAAGDRSADSPWFSPPSSSLASFLWSARCCLEWACAQFSLLLSTTTERATAAAAAAAAAAARRPQWYQGGCGSGGSSSSKTLLWLRTYVQTSRPTVGNGSSMLVNLTRFRPVRRRAPLVTVPPSHGTMLYIRSNAVSPPPTTKFIVCYCLVLLRSHHRAHRAHRSACESCSH